MTIIDYFVQHNVTVKQVEQDRGADLWRFECVGAEHRWTVTVPYDERDFGERLLSAHLGP